MELLEQIVIRENRREGGKTGKQEGNSSFPVDSDLYKELGREELNRQAKELERTGLVEIKWAYRNDVIERIHYRKANLPELFRLAGIRMQCDILSEWRDNIQTVLDQVKQPWIRQYLEDLNARLERGSLPADLKKERLLFCLTGLDRMDMPMWKRVFSARFCGDSKFFENNLEGKILGIVRRYHPDADEEMSDSQVLSQIGLEEYSQQLYCKGPLVIELNGKTVDLSAFSYGAALNSQTLRAAHPSGAQRIRKIVTVENQANFESMAWEAHTLFLFSHGFFSPKERSFLLELRTILQGQEVSYYHTGDLDYGGIRIFEYTKKIFPELKPLLMDAEIHQKYRMQGYGTKLDEKKREKLHALKTEELLELKQEILESGVEIEQECFL